MTPEQFIAKLNKIEADLLPNCAEIIAETATEYFKGSFERKAFDGMAWKRTNKTTGSTLIESGNLMNSIRALEITPQQVTIAAGNQKVAYARTHNEGGIQYVKAHHRISKKGNRHQVRGYGYHAWKRQFMGNSNEMFDIIDKRITLYLKSIT